MILKQTCHAYFDWIDIHMQDKVMIFTIPKPATTNSQFLAVHNLSQKLKSQIMLQYYFEIND